MFAVDRYRLFSELKHATNAKYVTFSSNRRVKNKFGPVPNSVVITLFQ